MAENGKRGLVFAGGGAKGSYQVGVYQALQELGWAPDIITGASVGCLNAALLAMGKAEEAATLWKTLDAHGVLELPPDKSSAELQEFLLELLKNGGLDLEPLGETIDRYLDEDALRAGNVRYGLVLTEMNSMRSIHKTLEEIPQGRLKEYMLASSACFPALRPREIDGVKYIDGGWRDNMPLDLAKTMGATELLGVDVGGVGYTRPNTTGLPTKILRSHWDLGPLFEFDGTRAERNMGIGYLDTMRLFGRMGGTAYGILPAQDGFLAAFATSYTRLLGEVKARVPALALAEGAARRLHGYPPVFEKDPTAPTAGALAPLEMAAEYLHVDPAIPYTPRMLGLTVLGSFEKDPADKFPALLKGEGALVGEAAMAAAAPDEFVTALASAAIQSMESGWQ
ncbi:MAG: patatin-like phospholipase family protein [Gemmiger sp.]|nr:patatin-like phospholipase family protein [Gemmiger sp.]